jgi:hypothetical protein
MGDPHILFLDGHEFTAIRKAGKNKNTSVLLVLVFFGIGTPPVAHIHNPFQVYTKMGEFQSDVNELLST